MKAKIIATGLILVAGIVGVYLLVQDEDPGETQSRPVESTVNLPPLPTTSTLSSAAPEASGDILDRLYQAPVPSMCQHEAGKLVDGRLPGVPSSEGYVALVAVQSPVRAKTSIASGDLNGDDKADVAAAFGCSQGGVNWPNWIVLYDDKMRILGSVNLGEDATAEHAEVKALSIEDQLLVMNWDTYNGAGFCLKSWSANVRLDGGRSMTENLQQVGPTGAGCEG